MSHASLYSKSFVRIKNLLESWMIQWFKGHDVASCHVSYGCYNVLLLLHNSISDQIDTIADVLKIYTAKELGWSIPFAAHFSSLIDRLSSKDIHLKFSFCFALKRCWKHCKFLFSCKNHGCMIFNARFKCLTIVPILKSDLFSLYQ